MSAGRKLSPSRVPASDGADLRPARALASQSSPRWTPAWHSIALGIELTRFKKDLPNGIDRYTEVPEAVPSHLAVLMALRSWEREQEWSGPGSNVLVLSANSPKQRCCRIQVSFYDQQNMSSKIPIGILGATGVVGQRFIQMLERHPWFECGVAGRLPDRSEGKTLL